MFKNKLYSIQFLKLEKFPGAKIHPFLGKHSFTKLVYYR